MTEAPLRVGRIFEKEVLGVTDEGKDSFVKFPTRRSFESSIQAIIAENWALYAESLEKGLDDYHNPTRPNMGKTGQLWEAVRKYLPKRVDGVKLPLNLYISVGRNALDWMYGVDAFFWWDGIYVTIDASLAKKEHGYGLQADFVLNPVDLKADALNSLGRKIADLLKERRSKFGEREKRKLKRIQKTRYMKK